MRACSITLGIIRGWQIFGRNSMHDRYWQAKWYPLSSVWRRSCGKISKSRYSRGSPDRAELGAARYWLWKFGKLGLATRIIPVILIRFGSPWNWRKCIVLALYAGLSSDGREEIALFVPFWHCSTLIRSSSVKAAGREFDVLLWVQSWWLVSLLPCCPWCSLNRK